MRQRGIKTKDKILESFGQYVVENPKEKKGSWNEYLGSFSPLYLEIGSGKGKFISELAEGDKDGLYLACEGGSNIYPRILEKIGAKELSNLLVIDEYIVDPKDYFSFGELSGVYISFCDPWPKDRYAHRRLTHVKKLVSYKEIMKEGSFLEFKTDNDVLFEWSLGQIEEAGLKDKIEVLERDHKSEHKTEYEEKFIDSGKTINFLRISF